MTDVEKRAVEAAEYLLENRATVRRTAAYLEVSKSTVHKDLMTHLKEVRPGLYEQVRLLLERNKAERHLRGGQATKEKYAQGKSKGKADFNWPETTQRQEKGNAKKK